MTQLVDQLLSTPEVPGLNPNIGKIYFDHFLNVNRIERTKIKKKRPGMSNFKTLFSKR